MITKLYKRDLNSAGFTVASDQIDRKEIFRGSMKVLVINSRLDANEKLTAETYERNQMYVDVDFAYNASALSKQGLQSAGWDADRLEAQLKEYINANSDIFHSEGFVVSIARPEVNGTQYVVALVYPGSMGEVVTDVYSQPKAEETEIDVPAQMQSRSLWGSVVGIFRN